MIQATSRQNTQGLRSEWFEVRGQYGLVKTEYQDLLQQTLKAMGEQYRERSAELAARLQSGGLEVKLTEEQKQDLSQRFDPENMSYSEYRSFLDTLCQFGVLEESDKNYLNYGAAGGELELIPLEYVFVGSRITPQTRNVTMDDSFASCHGKVLDWAKYRAGFMGWDEKTQSWKKTADALLFGKVRDVLEAIS